MKKKYGVIAFLATAIVAIAIAITTYLLTGFNLEAYHFKHEKEKVLENIGENGLEKSIHDYKELLTKYRNSSEKPLVELYIITMVEYAELHEALASKQAIDKRNEIFVGSKPSPRPTLLTAVAIYTQAIESYKNFIDAFGESKNDEFIETIATAYYNKAYELTSLSDKGAMEAYNIFLTKFSDSTNDYILELAARALNNKGVLFENEGQHQEAIQLYNVVIDRFENTDQKDIQFVVSKTLYNKGLSLQALEQFDDAIINYDKSIAISRTEKALKYQKTLMQALYRKSVILKNEGETETANKLFTEGETIFKHLVSEKYINDFESTPQFIE